MQYDFVAKTDCCPAAYATKCMQQYLNLCKKRELYGYFDMSVTTNIYMYILNMVL